MSVFFKQEMTVTDEVIDRLLRGEGRDEIQRAMQLGPGTVTRIIDRNRSRLSSLGFDEDEGQ